MVSEILGILFNKEGGAWPQGVPGWCHWTCLSIRAGPLTQSVGHLTRKPEVPGSIPGLATYFRFSFG